MSSGQHTAVVELDTWGGWVAPGAIIAGVLLLIAALIRRIRATLANKRRTTHPSTAEW